jgi:hypothetical protein
METESASKMWHLSIRLPTVSPTSQNMLAFTFIAVSTSDIIHADIFHYSTLFTSDFPNHIIISEILLRSRKFVVQMAEKISALINIKSMK